MGVGVAAWLLAVCVVLALAAAKSTTVDVVTGGFGKLAPRRLCRRQQIPAGSRWRAVKASAPRQAARAETGAGVGGLGRRAAAAAAAAGEGVAGVEVGSAGEAETEIGIGIESEIEIEAASAGSSGRLAGGVGRPHGP